MSVSLADIEAARKRIASGLYLSPCPVSPPLSEVAGCEVYCKLDYLQRTGSFKERGARHALMLLSEAEKKTGVIAASAGNHALGLAYHGSLLGIAVTVVMPVFAPLVKVTTCRHLRAQVILHGQTFEEAKTHALRLAEQRGLKFIPAYDDPAIIAGQGTMGLEILEQVPDLEAIVVPIGGGGLIAGVATVIKSCRPDVRVIGVEPERAACYAAACQAGHPVTIEVRPTLADGLAVSRIGELTFGIARPLVDLVVTVSEDELALAILRIAEREKGVVEGEGAAPLAACMAGKLPDLAGRRVVLTFCGGNIDPITLSRVIEKALVADGRLCRFTAVISDRPGGLAQLTQLIAGAGANINQITHDRTFTGGDVSAAHVLCVVETRDRQHIAQLHETLHDAGVEFFIHDGPGE